MESALTTTAVTTTIDYDEVVASYEESLTSTLRGFRPASVFLETWVHDEDTVSSLVNMAEAAEGAGLAEVVIRLGAKTASTLGAHERAELVRRGVRLGTLTIADRDAEGGAEVRVVFEALHPSDALGATAQSDAKVPAFRRDAITIDPPAPIQTSELPAGTTGSSAPARASTVPRPIDARYAVALDALAPSDHEGRLETVPHHVLVEAAEGGVTLGALIDPKSHDVRAARHAGGSGDTARRLLGALCVLLEGRPLHEGSDHAVVRLEHLLRDRSQPRVVAGIVLPQNADKAFAPLVRLARDLHARYTVLARVPRGPNEFEPVPGERWKLLRDAERIDAIQSAIDAAAPRFDLAPGDVVCDRIEHDTKVTIAITREIAPVLKARILMQIEQAVKASVERTLSFYLDEMKDKNKLRRLVLPSDLKRADPKKPDLKKSEAPLLASEVKA